MSVPTFVRITAAYLALLLVEVIVLAATGALSGATIALAAIGSAAALAIASTALWLTLNPLREIAQAAGTIAGGDFTVRTDAGRASGIAELADAFNHMAQGLGLIMEQASQERNRLMATLDSSADAVVAVDPDGRIAFANTAAEALLQRERDELVGNPFGWVMPDEQVLDAVKAAREDGRAETRAIERPNQRQFQAIATPIVGGGEWAALVVFHDISDVTRTERVRRDFVANVSHELRTPLAAIKSVIETLQGGALAEPDAAADFLARADAEADRLVQMVEELLELSRIESGHVPLARETVDLSDVLARAVERMREQAALREVALTLEVSTNLPDVTGDRERLERVVLNLLQNAIKFTPSGGSVHVSANGEGDVVTVRVHDTGEGIDEDELPRVFERFYKGDRSRVGTGSGLGLAIVKHTVEAHGGVVSVASEPGRGSTFTFAIPTAALPVKR